MLDPVAPRHFTIASVPSDDPGSLELCAPEAVERTRNGCTFQGLCTGHLARLNTGNAVPVWIRPVSFVWATAAPNAVWALGNGTGVAPLHSLLQEPGDVDTPPSPP